MKRRLAAVTAAVALTIAGCGSGGDLATQKPTDRLEVVSWWTSASEKPALESLLESYKAAHSGVTVVDGAVAGGGGSNVSVVLASRLTAGDPPDVWQTFVGSSTQAYARKGRVADVSSVYTSGNLAGVLPKGVLVRGSGSGATRVELRTRQRAAHSSPWAWPSARRRSAWADALN